MSFIKNCVKKYISENFGVSQPLTVKWRRFEYFFKKGKNSLSCSLFVIVEEIGHISFHYALKSSGQCQIEVIEISYLQSMDR